MERRGRGLLPLSRQVESGIHLRLHRASGPSFSFDFATSSTIWFGIRTFTSIRFVTNQPRDSVLRRNLYLAFVWSSSHEKAEGFSNNLKEVFRLVHHVLPSEAQHAVTIEDE
jgi:hypothetical protein